MSSITQKKVSNYIKEKGWSIPTISEKSGIPEATIKSIIYGKAKNQRISTLEKLAKVFGCSVNDLINEDLKNTDEKLDVALFKECLDATDSFLKKTGQTLGKEKMMKTVESLCSLISKKKQKKTPYSIDDATIEWIIDNII